MQVLTIRDETIVLSFLRFWYHWTDTLCCLIRTARSLLGLVAPYPCVFLFGWIFFIFTTAVMWAVVFQKCQVRLIKGGVFTYYPAGFSGIIVLHPTPVGFIWPVF